MGDSTKQYKDLQCMGCEFETYSVILAMEHETTTGHQMRLSKKALAKCPHCGEMTRIVA
jgi:hypothetical protein